MAMKRANTPRAAKTWRFIAVILRPEGPERLLIVTLVQRHDLLLAEFRPNGLQGRIGDSAMQVRVSGERALLRQHRGQILWRVKEPGAAVVDALGQAADPGGDDRNL